MFKPLSLFLGWRYVCSRHGNGFSAFISASSTIGIALGVTVLIVVLSAMNGFEKELSQKLLSIVPHVELVGVNEPIPDWREGVRKLQQEPQVLAAAPVIKMTGMLQHGLELKALEVRGVDVKLETVVSSIENYIVAGDWNSLSGALESKSESQLKNQEISTGKLKNNTAGIVIGSAIAKKLSVSVGDKMQLLLPAPQSNGASDRSTQDPDSKPVFSTPVTLQVNVSAIFNFGGTIDNTLAYINLEQASKLSGYKLPQVQSIRLKIDDVFTARKVARDVAYNFNHYVYINDWTRTQGHLFKDIQLVRMVMFIVLVLVIAVASFNIVSTLIMAVNEKESDIAILKTMGASGPVIMFAFIIQGLVNGVLGCFIGAGLGIYLALNLTGIIGFVEAFFNVTFLSGDVYFIDYLPSALHLSDVYITVITALVMSFLATLYPAWRATKIEPAKVLGQK